MKIGFIGLGIMGSRMAANLQNAGHDLVVHNRTESKADELVANGATWADTPRAVVAEAEVLFTMLAHPEAVRETMLGENGVFSAGRSGWTWVDCSTVNPSFAREMHALAVQHGVAHLDAPVAGTKPQAQNAELVFIVGGEGAALDKVRQPLQAMGKAINHVGPAGQGTALKIVVNYMLAASMLSFAEALALGESLGISQAVLLNTLIGGPVSAPFLAGKRAFIESGDYSEVQFPLRWMQKDTQMATTAAYETGVPMPFANAAKETYQMAIRQGFGDLDFSAMVAFFAQQGDT